MAYLIRNASREVPAQAPKPLIPPLFRRFSQETVLFFGGLFLLCWLLSMLSYSPDDPAWSTTGIRVQPRNLLGHVGAWAADISFFVFGRSVWLLFATAVAGWWRLLRQWMRGGRAVAPMPSAPAAETTSVRAWWKRWGRSLAGGTAAWWLAVGVMLAVSTALEWSRLYGGESRLPNGAGGMLGTMTGPVATMALGAVGSGLVGIILFLWSLDELPRPMLGYCRSGMRSTKTYEQTQHIRG